MMNIWSLLPLEPAEPHFMQATKYIGFREQENVYCVMPRISAAIMFDCDRLGPTPTWTAGLDVY